MTYPNLANGWKSTTSTTLTDSATSVTVVSVAGAPATPFQAVILAQYTDGSLDNGKTDEVVTVTNIAGLVLTITRATEANAAGSTTASAHTNGVVIEHVLTTGSLQAIYDEAVAFTDSIDIVIDGAGSQITTGIKGDRRVPFGCTIVSWTLLADQSGAIVVDVWRDSLANFPPTDADAMPGAGKEPTIAASGTNAEDTTVTDWSSYTITAGDVLRFNVDSCTSITRCTLSLKVTRTA
jgi:hypothetical protein